MRKIIISRKGFDSSNAEMPSPIMPDRTLLSLPIPLIITNDDHRKAIYGGIDYADLTYGDVTYIDLIKKLKPSFKHDLCHLDPDIYRNAKSRQKNWKACFGQEEAALTHLDNQKVNKGDIFLFFGWFRETMTNENDLVLKNDSKLKFKPKAKDQHILFGYLQIGKKYTTYEDMENVRWHPHAKNPDNKHNTIYEAADYLLDSQYPGYGTFRFSEELVLTKKNLSRSKWELPACFESKRITYHDQNSNKDGYFQSAMIGQEFVIESDADIENWIMRLVEGNRTQE